MIKLRRGTVVDVNLDPAQGSETGKTRPAVVVTNNIYNDRVPVVQVVPLTAWSPKKSAIRTNIVVDPTESNGLRKRSVADCLQTRPIDRRFRVVAIRGTLEPKTLALIDESLRIVFSL